MSEKYELEVISNKVLPVDPNYEIIEESGVRNYLAKI
jgi:hypothetical protein